MDKQSSNTNTTKNSSNETAAWERVLGVTWVGWGLILLDPGSDIYVTTGAYTMFAQLGWLPEWLLGALVAALGLARFCLSFTGLIKARAALAGLGCWEAVVLGGVFVSYRLVPGVVLYGLAAYVSGWVFVHLVKLLNWPRILRLARRVVEELRHTPRRRPRKARL